MKAAVFDTYVTRKDGGIMHFDIITTEGEDLERVIAFGKAYLKSKNQEGQTLSARECRFCHIENATPEVEEAILNKGYFILEMQGCEGTA